ncbi:activating enzyme ATG7 [Seminavis robusta]|uniref:Ubiquitin-like modifier-activating enzyme ATG7 n=1 Tax=Seminavis robusta TaxID=568900 RepID=A0A9N8HJC8_9STRA|nr:activating enzyme ATG7 [Seminavis robusta]|eukprot:Sro758_g198000.1 activating enzyme ATG7 (711) ;mRNA; f:9102-11234
MAEEEGWVVPFVPFASSIDSPFWVRYCREKLETIQLSEDPISLRASYGVEGPPRLQCQENAFQEQTSVVANERVGVALTLRGFNTIESFQKCDKNQMIHDFFAPEFLDSSQSALKVMNSVLLCVYPELKSHRVLYWMGVPAILTCSGKSVRATQQTPLTEAWSAEEIQQLDNNIDSLRRSNLQENSQGLPPFFLVTKTTCKSFSVESYTQLKQQSTSPDDEIVFAFCDPSGPTPIQPQQPMGWPLRNLVAFLCHHLDLGRKTVKVLSYRPALIRRIVEEKESSGGDMGDKSILLTIRVPSKSDFEWPAVDAAAPKQHKVLGWELNARNKPGPRWVNLRPLLDSNHLAIQAADLNLKLMKWRMIPTLNVDQLQKTKVLLIGAGTLGCSVARVLVGWGIRNMKIVDYGKVSYSNPVRQSLFTLEDCHFDNGSGRLKAAAASDALKTIAADMQSEGIKLSIPMPGHPETRECIEESVSTLDALVKEADAVFLLTDTRESRWLPTVMAAAHDKILINAALGLDSWLVIRHGAGASDETTECPRLGCYFCNDIVAPENSTKNRTLDQQCTVTRPGLAPIASSMAAELMVSLLHHPKRQSAPAPKAGSMGAFSPTAASDDPSSSGPLGIIPHQIRGSLVSYTMMAPTVPAFKHCTACAAPVIEAYKKEKMDLVFNACQSKDGVFLENTSGLTGFRADAAEKIADMEDWDEDDDGDM